MAEIFHIYASHGRDNYVELDLPASDHEMLDMMERLWLEPGKLQAESQQRVPHSGGQCQHPAE